MALTLRRRGKFWHARGSVPMRQADGRIKRVRIEESTREVSKARARRVADDIYEHYREQAYRPTKACPSFTDAALTYVETKNPSKRDREFAAKLVAHFGETPIDQIDQAAIARAGDVLYPGRSASTLVRAVYAPATTILRLSGIKPTFERPRVNRPVVRIPPEDWFDRVLQASPANLAALITFLTITGRRISEAVALTWDDVDAEKGTANIRRTKTGLPVVVGMPNGVLSLLAPGSPDSRVFGYSDRGSVKNALQRICKRHNLPYYSSHKWGRHAFASRLLKQGKSTKFVAEAGGWASTRMVDLIYGHLEQSDVARETAEMGQNWCKERKTLENPEEKG